MNRVAQKHIQATRFKCFVRCMSFSQNRYALLGDMHLTDSRYLKRVPGELVTAKLRICNGNYGSGTFRPNNRQKTDTAPRGALPSCLHLRL
ncbi:MAG: hypothetical protein E5W93_06225 [Mesorhizobium sp.]|nr:MAG: hypothetical protein E5W93_06225 [Mesorhizobium sp.]TIW21248.1 MAG: hypothetical protein E5V65_06460 [Mesorhizobium sp.]